MDKFLKNQACIISLCLFLGNCSSTRLASCPEVEVHCLNGITVQTFESYRPKSEMGNEEYRHAFLPSVDMIAKAFNEGKSQLGFNSDPIWIQAAGFVNINNDSLIVINNIYEEPDRSIDKCDILIGLGDYYESSTYNYSYNLNTDSVRTDYL